MAKNNTRETILCGLHIGGDEIRLAKILRTPNGQRRLSLDLINAPEAAHAGLDWLSSAIGELASRHDFRRAEWAVTLDGDFCVARVITGSPDEVTHGLERLQTRIQRYLSLGPGEKITGGYREALTKTTDYAVTGVANRNVMELLQEIFHKHEISPRSVEPALVAVARQMSVGTGDGAPVLLADGSSRQWDLGISQQGRLLLDYRPSGARESHRFGEILLQHISRIHRFCERHRQIDHIAVWQLYLFGPKAKVAEAQASLLESQQIIPQPLDTSPWLTGIEHDENATLTDWVGAIAAAMSLLDDRGQIPVADLLSSVRVKRRQSAWVTWSLNLAPAVLAASLLMAVGYATKQQRGQIENTEQIIAVLSDDIESTRSINASANTQQQLFVGLKRLDAVAHSLEDWEQLFDRIPKVMPDAAKLNRINMADDGAIRISGSAANETVVYDFLAALKQMPGVHDVLLQGTSPGELAGSDQVDFAVVLELVSLSDFKGA